MRKTVLLTAIIVAFTIPTATAANDKVTLCHATGSQTNPYVTITVAAAGAFNGHLGASHQSGRDIIPPFTWKGTTYSQNWDTTGQATFNNGCKAPAPATTTTVPTTTTVQTPPTTTTVPPVTTTVTDTKAISPPPTTTTTVKQETKPAPKVKSVTRKTLEKQLKTQAKQAEKGRHGAGDGQPAGTLPETGLPLPLGLLFGGGLAGFGWVLRRRAGA